MKRGSSLRFIEWPIPQICALVFGSMGSLLSLAQLRGCVLDGLDDVHVPGAAAQVAGDRLADVLLAGLLGARKERAAGHQHARRAVAALQAVLLPEAFLDGVQLAVALESLDGRDLA